MWFRTMALYCCKGVKLGCGGVTVGGKSRCSFFKPYINREQFVGTTKARKKVFAQINNAGIVVSVGMSTNNV